MNIHCFLSSYKKYGILANDILTDNKRIVMVFGNALMTRYHLHPIVGITANARTTDEITPKENENFRDRKRNKGEDKIQKYN